MVKVGRSLCTLDIQLNTLHSSMLKVCMSKEATVEATHSVPLVDVLSMGTWLRFQWICDHYRIYTSGLADAYLRHFHFFSIALQYPPEHLLTLLCSAAYTIFPECLRICHSIATHVGVNLISTSHEHHWVQEKMSWLAHSHGTSIIFYSPHC